MIGVSDFTGSVNSLCFSRADSGSMIVAIDDSVDKIISVWEWQRGEKGHKITETRVKKSDNQPKYLLVLQFFRITNSVYLFI